MTTQAKLSEIAKTIRSKNAGRRQDHLRHHLRASAPTYERVRRSGVLSRAAVCRIFGIPPARITDYVEFDPDWRSSSPSIAAARAAAPATRTSSALSNTRPLLDIGVPTE